MKDFPGFLSPSNGSYKREVLYKMSRIVACSMLSVRRNGTREHSWLKKNETGRRRIEYFQFSRPSQSLEQASRIATLTYFFSFFSLFNRVFLEKFASQSVVVFIGIQTIKSPEFGHVTNVDTVQPTCNPCSAFT